MSAKGNGPVRVGRGTYDWYFSADDSCRIERLVIVIEVMCLLPESTRGHVMDWISGLPYPWCNPAEALAALPCCDGLEEVEQHLRNLREPSSLRGG